MQMQEEDPNPTEKHRRGKYNAFPISVLLEIRNFPEQGLRK